MVNDGSVPWPKDTCMQLFDIHTDFELTRVIHLGGEVPCNSQVKVNFKIELKASSRSRHEFSYQLCYGDEGKRLIGQAIKFWFRLSVASDDSKLKQSSLFAPQNN